MKIDKIAIITLYGNINYGNKLQNYAVEQIFRGYGIEAVTIDYRKKLNINNIKRIINILTNYQFSSNREERAAEGKKEALLEKFSSKYLHVKSITRIGQLRKSFDYFCVGSDQVWNPAWLDDTTKHLMLLDFVEKEKKMTMSVSFGVEELPMQWMEFYKEGLSDFKQIAVREKTAEKIVKDLCDVSVDTYIDPTLMLDSKKWEEIAKRPNEYTEDYVANSAILYFLGEITDSDMSRVKKIVDDNNLHIIMLNKRGECENPIPSVEEWIYYIGHAGLVITDSFHGAVFSFLFDRNLIVYKRNDMYNNMFSRLENLMEKFDLKDRFIDYCSDENILSHDYSAGYCVLDMERKKLNKYIENMI